MLPECKVARNKCTSKVSIKGYVIYTTAEKSEAE